MRRQVFLGGAAGDTTWRRTIAIPALDAAGISYFDPQLGVGEWSEEREAAEMLAKDEADVLLFVLNGQTRGVATVAEAAYYIGLGRPLALAISDILPGVSVNGRELSRSETEDLNRGRIFLRTMARAHRIPVFEDVAGAVGHAIALVRGNSAPLGLEGIRQVLAEVAFGECRYVVEPFDCGYLLRMEALQPDADTGKTELFNGRKWHISREASRSEVVRTALKAALTWQEHEARERFTYRGKRIFGPHFDVDRLP